MDTAKLERINELARESRRRQLTADERAEQTALRWEYRQSVVGNLKGQLDHITVVTPED